MKIRKAKIQKQTYKIYTKEIAKYWHLYCTDLTKAESKRLIKRLQRKFNFKANNVDFNWKSSEFGGYASRSQKSLFFDKDTVLSMLLVCHECTHLMCFKRGIYGHPTKFYKKLDKVLKYVEDTLKFKIV